MKHVPDYIVPKTLKKMTTMVKKRRDKKQEKGKRISQARRSFERKQSDPLRMIVKKKR